MREAATNLEFEKAARLRDEVKRLREMELDVLEGAGGLTLSSAFDLHERFPGSIYTRATRPHKSRSEQGISQFDELKARSRQIKVLWLWIHASAVKRLRCDKLRWGDMLFEISEADEGFLSKSIERGEALLVLGAGASATSKNRDGEPVAQSKRLARIIAETAGQPFREETLWEVLSAVKGEYLSTAQIDRVLSEQYSNITPSDELAELFSYPWRRVYTWNIDDAIENIKRRGAQRLRQFNGLIDKAREFEGTDVLHFVKLHGDIGKPEHGFVLTEEEYNKIIVGQGHDWYKRAAQDYITNATIFIGSRLNEPILSAELDRARTAAGSDLGRAFLICPDELSPIQLQGLRSKKIVVIKATLADFVDWLGKRFPKGLTAPGIAAAATEFSGVVASRLTITPADLETARSIFPVRHERLQVQLQAMSTGDHDRLAQKFLTGLPPTWLIAASDIPVWLKDTSRLEAELYVAIERRDRVFMVTGQSGSGKTTATMQVLLKLLQAYPDLVVYDFHSDIKSLRAALNLLERLHPDQHVVAHIGDAFLYGDSLAEDVTSFAQGKITVVSGARTGEWNEHLARHLGDLCTPLAYQRFTRGDFDPLIYRLVKYVPAPRFKQLSHTDRIERMKRSNSQLLIALREATESDTFAEVITREYEGLSSDAARAVVILVGIATVARVGLGVAAAREAFSRLLPKSSFDDTLHALEGIVSKQNGRLIARHEVYVRHLIENVASFDLLSRVVVELLSTYTKYDAPIVRSVNREDMLLFKFVINHNFLKETFAKKGRTADGLNVYKNFEVSFQLDGHYWLQYGQYLKEIGRYEDSLTMLKRSVAAYRNNLYAFHALAEVELIVAGRRSSYDNITTGLIDDGVSILLQQDVASDITSDQYPVVTLSYEHVGALVSHGQHDQARKAATQYFERIQQLEKRSSATSLARAKERLFHYITFGEWNKGPRRSVGRRSSGQRAKAGKRPARN